MMNEIQKEGWLPCCIGLPSSRQPAIPRNRMLGELVSGYAYRDIEIIGKLANGFRSYLGGLEYSITLYTGDPLLMGLALL